MSEYRVATGSDPGTLVVSWRESSNFSRYRLQYRPTSSSDPGSMEQLTNGMAVDGQLLVKLTGLLNFTEYTVSVTPDCAAGGIGSTLTEVAATKATGEARVNLGPWAS